MFFDGFLIMIVGMTIVFSFLSLLYFLVSQFPRFFPVVEEDNSNVIEEVEINDDKKMAAIISAAVNYYYKQRN